MLEEHSRDRVFFLCIIIEFFMKIIYSIKEQMFGRVISLIFLLK